MNRFLVSDPRSFCGAFAIAVSLAMFSVSSISTPSFGQTTEDGETSAETVPACLKGCENETICNKSDKKCTGDDKFCNCGGEPGGKTCRCEKNSK